MINHILLIVTIIGHQHVKYKTIYKTLAYIILKNIYVLTPYEEINDKILQEYKYTGLMIRSCKQCMIRNKIAG